MWSEFNEELNLSNTINFIMKQDPMLCSSGGLKLETAIKNLFDLQTDFTGTRDSQDCCHRLAERKTWNCEERSFIKA